MGDDFDDGMYGFDEDYLYVEDEFGLADELAESQIADPGYSGINEEINAESFEYDHYEFWDDLEYANDEYWDYGGRLIRQRDQHGKLNQGIGQKRKRASGTGFEREDESLNAATAEKRRRIPGKLGALPISNSGAQFGIYSYDTVVFRNLEQQARLGTRKTPMLEKTKGGIAFMADWRKRFADSDPEFYEVPVEEMPKDMREAAEVQDVEGPFDDMDQGAPIMTEPIHDNSEWEDEDELNGGNENEILEGDENEEGEEHGLAIDPEMLKAVLRERLGAAGLEGMDENAFMQTIANMLSGNGNPDDAAGDLANTLLGQANGGNNALSGWLSNQGVNLDPEADQEQQDDASSVATAEVAQSTSTNSKRQSGRDASPDSAIEVVHTRARPSQTSEMALHPSSPESRKKHKIPTPQSSATKSESNKNDKKVKFDMLTSSPTAKQVVNDDHEEIVVEQLAAPSEAEENITAAEDNITAGEDSITVGGDSIAVGEDSIAVGEDTIVVGEDTIAVAEESIAVAAKKTSPEHEDADETISVAASKPRSPVDTNTAPEIEEEGSAPTTIAVAPAKKASPRTKPSSKSPPAAKARPTPKLVAKPTTPDDETIAVATRLTRKRKALTDETESSLARKNAKKAEIEARAQASQPAAKKTRSSTRATRSAK